MRKIDAENEASREQNVPANACYWLSATAPIAKQRAARCPQRARHKRCRHKFLALRLFDELPSSFNARHANLPPDGMA
jgi:hypothetical protein